MLDKRLKKMDFMQTDSDPCMYVATEGEMFVIAVHVDDIVLATKSKWQKSRRVLLRGSK